ncbi:MAG TPA: choice-of-anchor P family protein [Acidimicrobiales bacterium]|nr:choice-of-anchor P family protein [Acidimicrobiales bacterium]
MKVLRVLPLPVEVFVPRSRAQIDSQPRSIGFAAPVDIPLGELLGLLGIPVTLPTFCYSYFPATPQNPTDNQCGVVPFDPTGDERSIRVLAGAGSTHARGDADEAERASVRSQAAGNFVQTPAMSTGTVSTKTSTEVVDGVSIARAEVSVEAIDIAGIVKIDSIKSSAVARADGTGSVLPPEAAFTIVGLTIAGIPARLTPEGIQVGKVPSLPLIPIVGVGVPIPDTTTDLPLPVAAIVKPLVDALNRAGITFGVFEPPVENLGEGGSVATAAVRGLVVGFEDPATGDFVQARFGVATATATASANDSGFEPESDTGGGESPSDIAAEASPPQLDDIGGGTVAAASGTPTELGSPSSTQAMEGTLGGGTAPKGARGLVAAGPPTPATISRITDRLHGMYSAGAVGTLALLAGLALVLPARRRTWSAVISRR